MTEDFSSQALQYLLDELEPERRLAFEAQLVRDPAARAELKACADSLARFACDTAPAVALAPVSQRAVLANILAEATPVPVVLHPLIRRIAWARYAWPVAAALLVGLNLVDFHRPVALVPERAAGQGTEVAGQRGGTVAGSPAGAGGATKTMEETTAAAAGAPITRGTEEEGETSAGSAEDRRRLEKLRADYAGLQRASQALRLEYDNLVRHVAQPAIIEKGLGRLAAMELVDAGSYARGERKGLIELARGILTEPGVVAIDATIVGGKDATVTPGKDVTTPGMGFGPSEVGTTGVAGVATETENPYAWSVFDEAEHRGYLNLYNLPTVPADRTLQLWVKLPDSNQYQRVGEVPAQFQGASGSLVYTLPKTAATPTEILVTQELRNTTPVVPSTAIVLHGP